MPRHILTIEEQIRGLRRAINSPRTPTHLRRFLIRRRDELAADLDRQRRGRKRIRAANRKPGLLDFLGL